MLMVLTRQAVKRQRLVDVLFDPAGELRILRRPLGEPSGQIAARLGEIAAIVKPTQLLQAIIVDPARHVIEGVPQEMHVAALIGRLRQSLAQGGSETRWSSATTNSTPWRPRA